MYSWITEYSIWMRRFVNTDSKAIILICAEKLVAFRLDVSDGCFDWVN